MTSFAPIGPYGLRRSDLVAASLIIAFLTGARAVRIRMALVVAAALLVTIFGLLTYEISWSIGAMVWLLLVFIGIPALRSLKLSRKIYLSANNDGLLAETDRVRTLYKWTAISQVTKVGSRLFIMVTDNCALVVADYVTSRDNMAALIKTLDERRSEASF